MVKLKSKNVFICEQQRQLLRQFSLNSPGRTMLFGKFFGTTKLFYCPDTLKDCCPLYQVLTNRGFYQMGGIH